MDIIWFLLVSTVLLILSKILLPTYCTVAISIVLLCLLVNHKMNQSQLYRLGDVVKFNKDYFHDIYPEIYRKKFPKSIATEYFTKTYRQKDYRTLAKIVSNRKHIKVDSRTIVIHLRLGDVVNRSYLTVDKLFKRGFCNFCFGKYLHPISHYDRILRKTRNLDNMNDNEEKQKILIVTGFHNVKKNLSIEHKKSLRLLEKFVKHFQDQNYIVETRVNNNPDEDFLLMCNANLFIKSGGGYSNLIAEVVKLKKGKLLT